MNILTLNPWKFRKLDFQIFFLFQSDMTTNSRNQFELVLLKALSQIFPGLCVA